MSREALRPRPRRRPRPRILASGVMEFWSTGVLRIVGIAPRVRGVGGAFQAHIVSKWNLRWQRQIGPALRTKVPLFSLQTGSWASAGRASDFRKKSVKARKVRQELGSGVR
jgi:hypothetical protein